MWIKEKIPSSHTDVIYILISAISALSLFCSLTVSQDSRFNISADQKPFIKVFCTPSSIVWLLG